MLATRGAEVRLYARSAATRDAGVAFAKEQLPAVLAKLPGSKAGAIVGVDDMATALKDAWIVFESVPEDLELKKDIFKQVDALSDADAILASNSSSYSSSAFADSVKNPARLLNTHFLMPPEIIPVELMSCGQTDPAVIQLLVDLLPGYGLTPYVVQRESVGFVFNRVWAAIKRETLAVVAEGVASAEVVDAIYCQATGVQPGPFRLMDAVGLDVVLSIEENYARHRPGLPEGPILIRSSCCRAVTPSSSPTSSRILPSFNLRTVIPANRIVRPVFAGKEPAKKSRNAGPVCVPPPSQRPTT
jgi:3-hydroxybutyryl-CoA dehydrogenase